MTANARFMYFRSSNKFYSEGDGYLPPEVFRGGYVGADRARELVLGGNGGSMPALSTTGSSMRVIIIPHGDVGWPITLPPVPEESGEGAVPERRDPVVEAVRADLHRRSQLGITKYGTTLGENPGGMRDRLRHAYEEALDLANYLKWAITKLDEEEDRHA